MSWIETACAVASGRPAPNLGRVPTVIVSSAGVTETRRALDYSEEQWDRIVDTNLKGAWMVAQEAARCLIEAGSGGSIINVTSILATRVAGGVTPYLASKAGLKHLTGALALELARDRIRVNSLAPGYFATDLIALPRYGCRPEGAR